MNKNLLLVVALCAFAVAPSIASVTLEESTDAEYLYNQGYSQLTVEDVFMLKNRVNGQPIEPLYEKSQNKFVRACRKLYASLDPGLDEPDRLHHDVSPSPALSDL